MPGKPGVFFIRIFDEFCDRNSYILEIQYKTAVTQVCKESDFNIFQWDLSRQPDHTEN